MKKESLLISAVLLGIVLIVGGVLLVVFNKSNSQDKKIGSSDKVTITISKTMYDEYSRVLDNRRPAAMLAVDSSEATQEEKDAMLDVIQNLDTDAFIVENLSSVLIDIKAGELKDEYGAQYQAALDEYTNTLIN